VLTELGIGQGGGARWKHGGVGVDRRRSSTKNPVRSGAEGGEKGLGDDPGPTAMLLRDLAGAPVRQSGVAVVARGSAPLGARRAAAAMFWAALVCRMGSREVQRCHIKGTGDLGEACTVRASR
jgi:hypothetical protein